MDFLDFLADQNRRSKVSDIADRYNNGEFSNPNDAYMALAKATGDERYLAPVLQNAQQGSALKDYFGVPKPDSSGIAWNPAPMQQQPVADQTQFDLAPNQVQELAQNNAQKAQQGLAYSNKVSALASLPSVLQSQFGQQIALASALGGTPETGSGLSKVDEAISGIGAQPRDYVPQTITDQSNQSALSQVSQLVKAGLMTPAEAIKIRDTQLSHAIERQKLDLESRKTAEELNNKRINKANTINSLHEKYNDAMDSFGRLIGNEEEMGGLVLEAYNQATPWTTGRMGALGRATLGPESIALNSSLMTLRANQLVDTLKRMKELSPTGSSGFGNLTENEGKKLESLVASLDQDQGEKKLKDNLEKLDSAMRQSRKRISESYQNEVKNYGQSPQENVTPEMARAELARRSKTGGR